MNDTIDPVLVAAQTLRAKGVQPISHGDDVERWQVGDLTFDDAGLLWLAGRFGLDEAAADTQTSGNAATRTRPAMTRGA